MNWIEKSDIGRPVIKFIRCLYLLVESMAQLEDLNAWLKVYSKF